MNSGLDLKARFFGCPGSALVFVLAPAGASAKKSKSIKTEAFFISLDTEKNVMEVKVKKTGKKPKNKKLKLKMGKNATFNVKPEGSVLKRTTVALDGQRVDINEIEPNPISLHLLGSGRKESGRTLCPQG